MKPTKLLLFGLISLMAAGCNPDSDPGSGNKSQSTDEGKVEITPNVDPNASSRGADLSASCKVVVSSSEGAIRQYDGLDGMPESLWLRSGAYVAEAWAGDSVGASFTARYYRGYQPFVVKPGETTQVSLVCTLANVLVSVEYSDAVAEALSSYTLKVNHTRGYLQFEGRDSRVGAFMMPSTDNSLNWELKAVTADGKPFVKTGTIANPKRATEYKIKFSYSGPVTATGSVNPTIGIDANVEEMSHEVVVCGAPTITLDNGNVDEAVRVYPELSVTNQVVLVNAPAGLADATISFAAPELFGLEDNASYELFNASAETAALLLSKGINLVQRDNPDGSTLLAVNISSKLLSTLKLGDYRFDFQATDVLGEKAAASLTICLLPTPAD